MRKNKIEIGGHKVRDRHDLITRLGTWRSGTEVDFSLRHNGMIVSYTRKQAKSRKWWKNQLNKRVRRIKNLDETITIKKGLSWILV